MALRPGPTITLGGTGTCQDVVLQISSVIASGVQGEAAEIATQMWR